MTHEERAREWLEHDGGSDSAARRNALAAEFAAVEAEVEAACVGHADAVVGALEKRVAVLEAALKECAMQALVSSDVGRASRKVCEVAEGALSGEPTALLKMLERAAEQGYITGAVEAEGKHDGSTSFVASRPKEYGTFYAKRVWESRSDDIVHREGR